MFGALAKTWWASKAKIDPAKLVVVSIMPCTAKKSEAKRPEMTRRVWRMWIRAHRRELARMVRRAGIDFATLEEADFDDPLGRSTGAATLFGTTGGSWRRRSGRPTKSPWASPSRRWT
jgi:NADH-quinone oxidoreductase subunit G/NADP-reducing hydrogenase subunit HndD